MTQTKKKRLFVSGGDGGGNGKTLALILVADWLKSKGLKRAYIDCDTGNKGTARSFTNFLKDQPVRALNVQNPEDLDNIFNLTVASECDVLVDLPANASGNMAKWWAESATPALFESENIQLVTLIAFTPDTGSLQNALNWMETVGNSGTYAVCLNRNQYALAPKARDVLFAEWHSVQTTGYDVRTIEIDYLNDHAKKKLVAAECLPSQISVKDNRIVENSIKNWAAKVHIQLDETGI